MGKASGLITWVVGTLVIVAVGVFILSRLPFWNVINRSEA